MSQDAERETKPGNGKRKETVYFGYGSNLWLHQMLDLRCKTATYLGVARLEGYRWIINGRGYANVVEVSSPEEEEVSGEENKYKNVVFGLVYTLRAKDEEELDKNEGVPVAYTKEYLACDFWADPKSPRKPGWVDITKPPTKEKVEMLVYIDRERVDEARPKKEYVYRMNRGIEDAVRLGVPQGYVEEVMRRFIPEEGDEKGEVEKLARRQAGRFEDESGVFVRDG
ncbi:hypothetical protein P154DRAFT_431343 [Amniculicola lignicola CBS 123094]|uniref:gamma-glutamylcyclotransferase n=1 Tax=Amniculicola lignicola CBS 123094 TaxID=1392246 RepID=A0A6A5WL71_9PLEO|nr:hypothetical protein P154DRAFT_431343 [Amniculicola lignicola CBS 123094]